jgi:DNA-binding GntR family transcriptional regulator
MPTRPVPLDATERAKVDPRQPYEKIAAELRQNIISGDLRGGELAPAVKQLATRYGVAISTAQRAVALLRKWGLVTVSRGRRAVVVEAALEATATSPSGSGFSVEQHWLVTLRGPDGQRYPARLLTADIKRPDTFRAHLLGIARIEAPNATDDGERWIGDYELEIRRFGEENEEPAVALRWQVPL